MTRLFCNDLCVLENMYPNGIPQDIQIISDSPNIHLKHPAVSLNDRLPPSALVSLAQNVHETCISIYNDCVAAGFENDSYAIMFALTCEHNFLTKAAFLEEGDFSEQTIVTRINSNKKIARFTNHYPILFNNKKNCEIKNMDFANLNIEDYFQPVKSQPKENKALNFCKAFISNVFIYPLVTPSWPLLKRIWPRLGNIFSSKVALLEEIQISRSICTHLSFKGIGFEFVKAKLNQRIKKERGQFEKEAIERYAKVENIVQRHINDFLKRNIISDAHDNAFDYLIDVIKKAHFDYYVAYKTSQEFIKTDLRHTKILISNMLKNPTEYGFAIACKEQGIKTFCIQHGICREISPHFDYIPQITESNLPDYFICNTNKAAEVSVGFPFTKAEAIPVGITKDHYLGKKHIQNKKFPEIFYISTNVYTSNSGLIKAGGDDKMAYFLEKLVIDTVLSEVEKDILYKAYPTQQYLDTDPCHDDVLKHPNLKLYSEDKDLRYLSKYARVLITGKATSTFNWCFLTGKPVIFFDHPHLAPLRPELVSIFKDMLFYFDLTQPDVEKDILALLNKPNTEIENLYNSDDKKSRRKQFIEDYYFEENANAERNAYDFIKKFI